MDIDKIEKKFLAGEKNIDMYVVQLIYEVRRLREELSAFRKSEKELSDAYLRIRELVGAWDTKPGGEDRFEVTEAAVRKLREDEKRLDWLEGRNGNKYLLSFWADNGGTLREAIDTEMKEAGNG